MQALVGLTEALRSFTGLFSSTSQLQSLQASSRRQLFVECEKDVWLGLVRAECASRHTLRAFAARPGCGV